MDDLEHYYTSLYDEAAIYVFLRRAVFSIFFITLGFSIYAKGNFLYVATLGIVILQITVWILKIKIDNIYQLAHNFQKHEMLKCLTDYNVDINEITDLKQKVSTYVVNKVNRKKQNNIDSVQYFNTHANNEIESLKNKIHENSYFNYYLYEYTYKRNLLIIILFCIITVIPILFFIPYIKIDPELSLPRLVFTLLSFSLIYEFLESTLKYKETSKVMRGIDLYLYTTNKDYTNSITDIFSRYNEAKLITPYIPAAIFKKYKNRLNEGWNERRINK